MNRIERYLKEKWDKMTDEERKAAESKIEEEAEKWRTMKSQDREKSVAEGVVKIIKFREFKFEHLIRKTVMNVCEGHGWGSGIFINETNVYNLVMKDLAKCGWQLKTIKTGKEKPQARSKKFKNVPEEIDKPVILEQEIRLGKYDVLFQFWYWEGILASSIIFNNKDIPGLDDEELQDMVKENYNLKPDSGLTVGRSETGFTFVNFNFEPIKE